MHGPWYRQWKVSGRVEYGYSITFVGGDIQFVSPKGEFLPPQLICLGKTPACHPKHVKYTAGFHVTQTENHWSNERVHVAYLKKTIIPHIKKLWKQLNLNEDQKAFSKEKPLVQFLNCWKITTYRRRCQLTKPTFSNR